MSSSVPTPSVSRSHAVENVPVTGLYSDVRAAGAQGALCAVIGEDDGEGIGACPAAG